MVTTVVLPLQPIADRPAVRISCLEGKETFRGIPRLVDKREDPARNMTIAPVRLLEESEYRYEILGLGDEMVVHVEPAELFSPDPPSHISGRIQTGRSVGNVAMSVFANGEAVGQVAFEIRSRKLGYLTDYRWMLEGVSSVVADVLLSGFAPANVHLGQDWSEQPQSLYPRFALLNSVLTGDEFDGAIAAILNDPHNQYLEFTEQVDPSRGIRGGSGLAASLTRPGPRVEAPGLGVPGLATLPRSIDQTRHLESSDTVPNQFVKFALESWREVVDCVLDRLSSVDDDSSRRGVAEGQALLAVIDNVLTTPLMRSTGRLEAFPSSNQVLQKRAGYRDFFRLFIQTEAAAALEWGPKESVFPAGSKDVATLYEYWVYLELARIVESLGFSIDRSALISSTTQGLVLNLNQGSTPVIHGSGQVAGREMTVELFYNRSFYGGTGTWTRTVRPDCSIRFTFTEPLSPESEVWVHFDAKYRIHDLVEAFGEADRDGDGVSGESRPVKGGVLSEDLMKMHTYRDAISRTAGSYVLFPGVTPDKDKSRFQRYEEILPGLGGFAMRPDSSGQASTTQSDVLEEFLEDIVEHMAARGTEFERSDYWEQRSHDEKSSIVVPTSDLVEPPADTSVLIGYVKGDAHWAWIVNEGQYNLRADDREGSVDLASDLLRARFLLAYSLDGSDARLFRLGGDISIRTASDLIGGGYPNPGGTRYACLAIDRELHLSVELSTVEVQAVREKLADGVIVGTPVLVRWSNLFAKKGEA